MRYSSVLYAAIKTVNIYLTHVVPKPFQAETSSLFMEIL